MNALTHNGKFTVTSPTGEHRTFRVKTQPKNHSFRPGARILSVLQGSDYRQFAFVTTERISVWNSLKTQDTIYEKYADLLARQEYWETRGFEYEASVKCRVCNRELTNPESLASGIGPECAKR